MRKRLTRTLLSAAVAACFFGSVTEAKLWPGGHSEIKRLLDSKDVNQRRDGARRTSELSARDAKVLIAQALLDDDREVRLLAIRVARNRGYHELSKGVADWLSSQQVDERIEAIRLLSLEPDEANIALIESACIDADAAVRRAAVVALAAVPLSSATRASVRLMSMLDDSDADVRQEVAASLGKLGESAAALTLAAHLKDQDANVRVQVALALGALGSQEAVPALLVGLSDAHDDVVAAVAASLGESGSEQAIPSLVKLAEGAPHRPQTREAVLSLVRLSHFESARKVVVDLLGSPDHVALVRSVLAESPRQSERIADDCLHTYSADLAYICALELLKSGSASDKVMAAYQEGRLSLAQVLSLLEARGAHEATLLALESLSSAASADEQSAIRFLSKAKKLTTGADIPLLDALRARSRPPAEVVMLLNAIGRVDTAGRPLSAGKAKRLRTYLSSTSADVKSAAAQALAARGAEGKDLRELLLGDGLWAKGALEGLTFRMTPSQAETVIELCKEGKSGRNRSFYSVFWAMPSGLSESAKAGVLDLLMQARGADRDALFYPLVANWDSVIEEAIKERVSARADLLKIAQLAWYGPKTLTFLRRLMKNGDAHVAAAAARSVGRHGSTNDVVLLRQLSISQRPYLVRAAALEGLRYAAYRGLDLNAEKHFFSDEVCLSGHDLYRAEGLRLAASLGVQCGERPLEEVLLRDNDPRMRRLAASLLSVDKPDSSALRRCGFYEPRVEVAQICRGGRSTHWGETSQSPSRAVPYQITEVRAQRSPARLLPVTLLVPSEHFGVRAAPLDHVMRLSTDRAGHVVIPQEGGNLVDTTWHF